MGVFLYRKLRVSLENDFGNTTGSAKIVRLFVPYWLCDDAALPLSYRLVEIEPSGSETGDSSWLNKAAKAAKQAARRPARGEESKKSHLHKVVQSLEVLEDSHGAPAMLSLQAQSDRIGGLSLANNTEGGPLSPRLGLVVTIGNNTRCSYALSFRDLEENVSCIVLLLVFCYLVQDLPDFTRLHILNVFHLCSMSGVCSSSNFILT